MIASLAFRAAFFALTLDVTGRMALANESAPSVPSIKIVKAGGLEPIDVAIAPSIKPPPAFEWPPIVVAGAPDLFFVTTGWSWLCRGAGLKIDARECARFSLPDRLAPDGRRRTPAQAAKVEPDWVRSYAGVTAAVKLSPPWHGDDLLAVLHGENKNERSGSDLYANSVDTTIKPADCASGYDKARRYTDCWAAYNAFVSLRLARSSAAGGHDLGPVLWPTMGYRQGTKKTSGGLRDPSAVVDGGFLYLFYTDSSVSDEEGRRGGVHVARLRLPKDDKEAIGPALPFFDGGFRDTNPSLPFGFSKDRIRAFYDRPGGRASELWPESWKAGCFVVARAKGIFVGAEEYVAGKDWGVRLRASSDLVHWSDSVDVPHEHSDRGWGAGTLHYPVFRSVSGRSDEIDPAGFFLLGAQAGGRIVRQSLTIELKR